MLIENENMHGYFTLMTTLSLPINTEHFTANAYWQEVVSVIV